MVGDTLLCAETGGNLAFWDTELCAEKLENLDGGRYSVVC